jgi:hypothetical protein
MRLLKILVDADLIVKVFIGHLAEADRQDRLKAVVELA